MPDVSRNPLAVIDEEGMLVDVDCSGMGVLDYRFSWEDLGVDLPESAREIVGQPPAKTIPRRYAMKFTAAVQIARQATYTYAIPQPSVEALLGQGWRWVPWTAQASFEAAINHAKELLQAAKALIERDRTLIESEIEATLGEVAANAERSLRAVRGVELPEDFRSRVLADGLAKIPSCEQIENIALGYKVLSPQAFGLVSNAATVPALVEGKPLSPKATRAWQAKEIARMHVEAEGVEIAAEREAKDRQREIKIRAAREFAKTEFDPLKEVMAYVRGEMVKEARELLGTIEKRGFLPGSSAEKVTGLATWFKAMNVSNDQDLQALIEKLQALSEKPTKGQKRSVNEVTDTLIEIVQLTQEASREAVKSGRMARMEV